MVQEQYRQRQAKYTEELDSCRSKDRRFSVLRALIMLAASASVYLFFTMGQEFWLVLALIGIIAFSMVLFRHLELRRHMADLRIYIRINQQEIAYLDGDLTPFPNGKEWIATDHLFSNDLDLFGNHSLFQHLNRTVTLSGKILLCKELLEDKGNEISGKQKALQELSQDLDWRQDFMVAAGELEENPNLKKTLNTWLEEDNKPKGLTSPFLLYPLALITLGLLINWMISPSLETFNWFSYAFGVNLALVFSQYKFIKKEYEKLNHISKSLNLYSRLLKHIEGREFKAKELVELKGKLKSSTLPASTALRKLSKLLDGFDQLNNVVALILTNGLYHYHLHVLRGLYEWRSAHGQSIHSWLEVVAQFDQYVSRASFAFNHPDLNYPEVSSQMTFSAKGLGHPLINSSKRVVNDLGFEGFKYGVLTGSNMSGKSTFLRSIGINLILMKMGLPVCADQMTAYPFRLLSSMKVSDSLDKEESYFQAEVLRLKRVLQVLESGEACMVLLDEILRGTNSEDKRNGTRLFMERIASCNALGMIATHDIDIADLAQKDGSTFKALYFESRVQDGELYFDYKLREGICTTANATDLMRAQGIL